MRDRRQVDAKLVWLHASHALPSAARVDLMRLIRWGDRVTVLDGSELATIGAPPKWVHLIVDGTAVATVDQSHWLLTAGTFIGDVGAFAAGSSPYTATALGDIAALAFTARNYLELADTVPCVRRALRAAHRAIMSNGPAIRHGQQVSPRRLTT